MENVKGLIFDVEGTVFDWKNTARENIQKLADEKGESIDSEAFTSDGRGEMFKIHTQVQQESGRVIDNNVLDGFFIA
jgi:2-haloacid dehalogenase